MSKAQRTGVLVVVLVMAVGFLAIPTEAQEKMNRGRGEIKIVITFDYGVPGTPTYSESGINVASLDPVKPELDIVFPGGVPPGDAELANRFAGPQVEFDHGGVPFSVVSVRWGESGSFVFRSSTGSVIAPDTSCCPEQYDLLFPTSGWTDITWLRWVPGGTPSSPP